MADDVAYHDLPTQQPGTSYSVNGTAMHLIIKALLVKGYAITLANCLERLLDEVVGFYYIRQQCLLSHLALGNPPCHNNGQRFYAVALQQQHYTPINEKSLN